MKFINELYDALLQEEHDKKTNGHLPLIEGEFVSLNEAISVPHRTESFKKVMVVPKTATIFIYETNHLCFAISTIKRDNAIVVDYETAIKFQKNNLADENYGQKLYAQIKGMYADDYDFQNFKEFITAYPYGCRINSDGFHGINYFFEKNMWKYSWKYFETKEELDRFVSKGNQLFFQNNQTMKNDWFEKEFEESYDNAYNKQF